MASTSSWRRAAAGEAVAVTGVGVVTGEMVVLADVAVVVVVTVVVGTGSKSSSGGDMAKSVDEQKTMR